MIHDKTEAAAVGVTIRDFLSSAEIGNIKAILHIEGEEEKIRQAALTHTINQGEELKIHIDHTKDLKRSSKTAPWMENYTMGNIIDEIFHF